MRDEDNYFYSSLVLDFWKMMTSRVSQRDPDPDPNSDPAFYWHPLLQLLPSLHVNSQRISTL